MTAHNHGRVSPFGHPRINAQLTTPRGISQSPTSFIGSSCQGIHRAPLTHNTKNASDEHKPAEKPQISIHTTLTKLHQKRRYSRPLYSSQTTQSQRTGAPTTNRTQQCTTSHKHPNRNKQHTVAVPDTQQRNEPSSHTINRQTTQKRADLHPDKQKHPTPVLTSACTKNKAP